MGLMSGINRRLRVVLAVVVIALLGWAASIGVGAEAAGASASVSASGLASGSPSGVIIDRLVLKDTIQPVTAGMLNRALARANADGSAALLIELDTPGGLITSMRAMAGAILTSRVPVIVFVTPAGARAGSAGFFLLEAADVAAMAPGTNAGAAHPVPDSGKADDVMSQKIVNDTEAFLRSYVSRRNRNAEAAEASVHASHSYTAEEALDQHLIDLTASSDAELMAAMNNRPIRRLDGSTISLQTVGARIVDIAPTLRERLLNWLIDPNIAMLLLVGGALLIYLEFNAPGTIVPGALGTVMVLLAVFALNLLPIHYTAVLLLVAAVVLIVLEAKFGGHGVLGLIGVVCLGFGMVTLVDAPVPELSINPWIALSISAAFGGISIFLVRLAWRARHRKLRLGLDALIGEMATAMEALDPRGHVLVEGEIWDAVAEQPVAAGERVKVLSCEQYWLHVGPVGAIPTASQATPK